MKRTIVTVPTYNEAENIKPLIKQLRALDLEVIVADDNSPDGTWKIVEELAQSDPKIHLLLRREKKGRGYAGAEAFGKAVALGAERIVEMDADLSHQPNDIPAMLAALDGDAQMVIGSRFVPGGTDTRDSMIRNWLTRFSCVYARLLLGVPVADTNSGFRAFEAEVFQKVRPENLVSPGPGIVHELLVKVHLAGFKIREVPITFVDRTAGESELTFALLLAGFKNVWDLRRKKRLGGLT